MIPVYILSVLGVVFLFVGGPDYYSPRPYRVAWDVGHIALFFLWTYALILTWKGFARKPFQMQFILILLIALFVGLSIEWAQSLFQRTFSIDDTVKNIVGGAAAVVFLSPTRITLSRTRLRAIQIIVCLSLVLVTYPFVRVLTDEVIARAQFPTLSSFETPFEMHRWQSRSVMAIDQETVKEGRASLKVSLTTERYSGAGLEHFPSDWRGYKYLHISIFNASREPLTIVVRVNDVQHRRSKQSYSDRFNRQFVLGYGWNDIDIPLEDIASAPKNRVMNLRSIRDIVIFASNLKAPKVIYVDDVRLKGVASAQ